MPLLLIPSPQLSDCRMGPRLHGPDPWPPLGQFSLEAFWLSQLGGGCTWIPGWMSGMLLSTVQRGRLAPTTKCDQAPEAPGLDPGHPTGPPMRMNVLHICTGHLRLLSSSNGEYN